MTPRVAMISYSNFGTVRHPDVTRIHRTIDMVRERRPQLEIDGEMQLELALDPDRCRRAYPFTRLTASANTLVFPSLASGNAAYQIAKTIGGASAVGPIILGLAKPVAAMQNEASVEEIVNMTAYVVLRAQQMERASKAQQPRHA